LVLTVKHFAPPAPAPTGVRAIPIFAGGSPASLRRRTWAGGRSSLLSEASVIGAWNPSAWQVPAVPARSPRTMRPLLLAGSSDE